MRLLLPLLLAGCVAAEPGPPRVSDGEIREHQLALSRGCFDEGARRGEPPARTERYCGCVSATLGRNVSRGEWEEAILHARAGRQREAVAVLRSHLARLDSCLSVSAS